MCTGLPARCTWRSGEETGASAAVSGPAPSVTADDVVAVAAMPGRGPYRCHCHCPGMEGSLQDQRFEAQELEAIELYMYIPSTVF